MDSRRSIGILDGTDGWRIPGRPTARWPTGGCGSVHEPQSRPRARSSGPDREGALHEGVVAGHGAAELQAGDVGGHDPGELLDPALPVGDAGVGRGGLGTMSSRRCRCRSCGRSRPGCRPGRRSSRRASPGCRVSWVAVGRRELEGAGGDEVDDAGLAGLGGGALLEAAGCRCAWWHGLGGEHRTRRARPRREHRTRMTATGA